MKKVVTAGAKGADIDVLACAVAYSELLRLEGEDSTPVVADRFTATVTPSILDWGIKYENSYSSDGSEEFVLVDISDPRHVPDFVDLDRVVEVYDHRAGHEDYWYERLGKRSHIEMVGACGTQIWEEFQKRGKSEEISETSAKLLLASIVSNNLNFKSPLMKDRDEAAYQELSGITGLGKSWIEEYFTGQERVLMKDFERYLETDTKIFKIGSEDFAIGQIELWNAESLLDQKKEQIDKVMQKLEPIPWIVNIVSISQGFNYIYSTSKEGKKAVSDKLGVEFMKEIAKTDDLLMRKYIMKQLRS